MATADLTSKYNPLARSAAQELDAAYNDAGQATDAGLMGAAQVRATVGVGLAILSLELQVDRLVERLEDLANSARGR